jgi:hypothetical protein
MLKNLTPRSQQIARKLKDEARLEQNNQFSSSISVTFSVNVPPKNVTKYSLSTH